MITPIVLTNIATGTHAIKLELYHYKTKEEANVIVTAGETTNLNWALTYASTETLTIQPGSEGKDADVYEPTPNTNSGNYLLLYVGYDSGKWRSYLQFDVSPNPLPSDAIVTNAYLRLYQYYSSDSLSIGVYQVTSNWSESSITWNTQPTSSSVSEDYYSIGASSGTETWYVDDLVMGWIDGSISNYGLLLKPTDEASNDQSAYFYSSDYTSNISKCPKLEIDYYIP